MRRYSLEARVDDGSARGTMRLVENLRHPSGATYVCESGAVTFSARAG